MGVGSLGLGNIHSKLHVGEVPPTSQAHLPLHGYLTLYTELKVKKSDKRVRGTEGGRLEI